MKEKREGTNYFFVYDLKTGEVVENPNEDEFGESNDFGEYRVRYFPHADGNWATIGDGFRHNTYIQDYHWDRLLIIIKDNQLDQSGLDVILDGWLGRSFPNQESKNKFVSAVREGKIKLVVECSKSKP